MSEEKARGFAGEVRAGAVAPPTPRQQLDAFRLRVHAILSQELKVADVKWSARRDLHFVIEEFEYRLFFEENDPLYVTLSAGLYASFRDEKTRVQALEAASTACMTVKVAKVFVVPDEDRWLVGATLEALLPGFDMVDKAFIKRWIGLLRGVRAEFQRCYDAA
jgi:hypothetical protein